MTTTAGDKPTSSSDTAAVSPQAARDVALRILDIAGSNSGRLTAVTSVSISTRGRPQVPHQDHGAEERRIAHCNARSPRPPWGHARNHGVVAGHDLSRRGRSPGISRGSWCSCRARLVDSLGHCCCQRRGQEPSGVLTELRLHSAQGRFAGIPRCSSLARKSSFLSLPRSSSRLATQQRPTP